jgi:hypothetical protein
MARTLSIIRYIIRILQKVFLGLYLSCLFPIDLIDVLQYFIPTDTPSLVEASLEDNIEEDNNKETNSHYLLIIIPATTILFIIVGGICDLHLDNLLLSDTIVELLSLSEEHVQRNIIEFEDTASKFLKL